MKENKDGSLTFIGKKNRVTIPEATVDLDKLYHFKPRDLIQRCPLCKKKAFLKVRNPLTPVGDTILVHYVCLDCGYFEETTTKKYQGYV